MIELLFPYGYNSIIRDSNNNNNVEICKIKVCVLIINSKQKCRYKRANISLNIHCLLHDM